MSSRVKRTTTSAALVWRSLLALLVPGLARADEAAGHYNLARPAQARGQDPGGDRRVPEGDPAAARTTPPRT